MSPLTPESLRRWADVLGESTSVRLAKVLDARDLIRRESYERDHIMDRVAERLAVILH